MKTEDRELLERQDGITMAAGGENAGTDKEESPLVVQFKKPYWFEKKEYTEVDLSNLENMTAADMVAVETQYGKRNPGGAMPELKMEYALMMAARAAEQPLEFFYGLPLGEAVKVKNKITGFLFGAD